MLREVAAEWARPPAEIALAWAMARPGITSTIIGASSLSQLQGNIAATGTELTADQMNRLDEASVPLAGFSASLTTPFIRRMVFGGQTVTGWAE